MDAEHNPPTDSESEATVYDDDADSTLGTSDFSSTVSLASSIMRYREENGRRYHSYKEERNYVLPNDESENERLDLQNHLISLTLENKLFTCPAKNIHRVLDVGTGTGIWAIDFADEYPGAEVIGVDLSPIQPTFVPPNVRFLIDDVEDEWAYSARFNFIYVRMMTGSISDWPKLIRQSYENLMPDGYVEITDITFPILSDDGSLTKDSALAKWSDLMLEASLNLNRPLNSAKSYKTLLNDAGFEDVVETEYSWPQNPWPKDKKQKQLGMWTLENISNGIQGLSLALFTRGLKWSVEELEVLLAEVRENMRDRRIHSYWKILVVSGKKP